MNSAQILARAAGASSAQRQRPLTDEEVAASAGELQSRSEGTLGTIGRVLDTPGSLWRGYLVGKPLSGLGWSDESRVSGAELLEHFGLIGKEPGWGRTLGGLAAEIVLDPLHMLSGPLKALGKAGGIAEKAGLLQYASKAAQTAMGTKAAAKTITGARTTKFLKDLLPKNAALSKANLAIRPLVGPRVAQNLVDIQQVINAAPDSAKALRDVENALRARKLTMDSIKGQKLGGSLRFQVGEGKLIPPLLWSPRGPTAMKTLDAMDAIGNAFDWSPLARATSTIFDQRVNGRYSALDQLGGLRRDKLAVTATGAAREASANHIMLVNRVPMSAAAQKIVGGKDLNTPLGGEFLTRLYEGGLVQSDKTLLSELGSSSVDAVRNSWENVRTKELAESKALGMVTKRYKSPFKINWSPRKAAEVDFGEYGKGIGRKAYNARTLENEARVKYLQTPGGTFDLQQISRLPLVNKLVQEGGRSGISIKQLGAEIKRFIDAKHAAATPAGDAYLKSVGLTRDPRIDPFDLFVKKIDPATGKPLKLPQQGPLMPGAKPLKPRTVLTGEAIDQAQSEKIARFMSRKDPRLPAEAPIFGGHPSIMQASAMVSSATARANARHIYDSLAESAVWAGAGKNADSITGNARKPLDRALLDAAQAAGLDARVVKSATGKTKTPMSEQILIDAIVAKNRIAAKNQMLPADIKLSEWSIPEPVLNRLTSAKDIFETPRVMKSLGKLLTDVNGIYKSFLLAFPATKTRDMYSNTYQIFTLTGSVDDTLGGMTTAWRVVSGKAEAATDLIRTIPAYAKITNPQEALDALSRDVSRTGILQSLASSDLATSNRAANLNQLIPGMVPQKLSDFRKDLIPDGTRNPLQMAKDYVTFNGVRLPFQKRAAVETKNGLLNASQKVNDFTDSVGRLGGMLALMRQGWSPEEAARKVTNALVDYASLTLTEKTIFKTIFPWWSYQSRSGAWAAKELLSNPGGRYAQTLRGFNRVQESDKDTYVPEALRQQFAVKIPDWIKVATGLGKSETTTFLKDLDIAGHDVASLPVLGPTPYDAFTGTLRNLAGQTNPLIRSGIELSTGTDLFTKRPLREADSSLDKVYRGITGSTENMNPIVRQAINLIPSPRWSGIAATALDPKIPNLQTRLTKNVINTLFGIKLQDVDKQYQYGDARRMYEGQLGGVLRNQTIPFIPADKKATLTPQQQHDYAMFEYYDQLLRKERERKRLLNP